MDAANTIIGLAMFWKIVVVVLIVVWMLLPFAVFGLKRRIDKTNDLLRWIGDMIEEQTPVKPGSSRARRAETARSFEDIVRAQIDPGR